MASGIKGSGNRPKTAKHLRKTNEKSFAKTTKEDRDREHAASDAWAARQREATGSQEPDYSKRPDFTGED